MVTRANKTVLDLTDSKNGEFESLKNSAVPSEPHDVPNLMYLDSNFLSVRGGALIDATLSFKTLNPEGDALILDGHNDLSRYPTICIGGDGYIHSKGALYLGSEDRAIHFIFGSDKVAEAREAFCIHEYKLESNIGVFEIRSPDVVGSPDPSPYILLESVAPGEPVSPGGSMAPALVMRNPDQPAQAYPYEYTKISNRDGTILQIEGDNDFGTGTPVTHGIPVFAIKQSAGVYADLFMNVLKRVGAPQDDDDAATKKYVDEMAGVIASSSYGPTGYVVFQGGLTMQWGIAPAAPSGSATVTLPITWGNALMVGFCAAEVTGGDTKAASVASASPSQITIRYNHTGTPVNPVAGSWIALGY